MSAEVILHEVFPGDQFYQNVSNEFYRNWQHYNKRAPTIHRMFYHMRLVGNNAPWRQNQAHHVYKQRVGNETMLYHGTKRTCLLGQNSWQKTPCYNWDCSLCSILRCDFNVAKSGPNNRYGRGIYTSSVSSKADDYASSTQSNLKCVLYSNVALGRVQDIAASWNSSITGPAYGYDSIRGLTTSQGGALNYPENVVYNNDAINVNTLIFYE